MKKMLCLLLSFIFVIISLASCAVSSNTTSITDADKTQAVINTTQEDEDIYSGLEIKDYEGRTFNFLVREDQAAEFYSEGETGEIINDAVFLRNRTVEDNYNIKINVIKVPGDWANKENFLNTLRTSIMAGDGAYDLVDGYAAYIGDLISTHLFMNLLELPYLRLTEEWWSQKAVDEMTVNDKLYVAPGDLSINLWRNIMTMFFNKKLFTDAGIEYPYALVKDGKWTIDELKKIVKGLQKDVDGNSSFDENDQYGLMFYDDLQFNNFHAAFNIPISKKDKNGLPFLNIGSPEVADLVQTVYDLAYNTDGFIFANTTKIKVPTDNWNYAINMFAANKIYIMFGLLNEAEKLRSMEAEFGIIPVPKMNVEQKEYKTTSRDGHSMFCIPIDVPDSSFSAHITEALCVSSNKFIVPAYYDKALKTKFARDDESGEMLDIIRKGLTFDFAAVFAIQLDRSGFILRDVVNNKLNFTSEYEKNIGKFNTALDSFLKNFED